MAGATLKQTGPWAATGRKFKALGDMRFTRATKLIAARLLSSTQQRFRDERGPDGTPWKKSIRARKGQRRDARGRFDTGVNKSGGKTLTDTARLRRSITSHADAERAEVGTNVIYAGIHQFGGLTGRGHAVKMPARPFLGLSADDEKEIDKIITAELGALLDR